jgi:hypothetical protein
VLFSRLDFVWIEESVTVFPGVHSEEVTPVPIPNTEVKGLSGEGTTGISPWESSTMPGFFLGPPFQAGLFFSWVAA